MEKLYIVGPMGEPWQDIPLRALRILRESSLIVVRDLDLAREWLWQAGIRTHLVEVDSPGMISTLLAALRVRDVAWLIAGLAELDSLARHLLGLLIEQGVEPLSVPGPSSAISGLAVSGLPASSLTLLGALSDLASERRSLFESVADEPASVVCEVTADSLEDVFQDIQAVFGDRRVMLYGEHCSWRGRVSQVGEWTGGARLTLVVEGTGQPGAWSPQQVGDEVAELLATGASSRDVARMVALRSGWPRKQVYQLVVSVGRED